MAFDLIVEVHRFIEENISAFITFLPFYNFFKIIFLEQRNLFSYAFHVCYAITQNINCALYHKLTKISKDLHAYHFNMPMLYTCERHILLDQLLSGKQKNILDQLAI